MTGAGRTPLIAGNWKMHKTIAEARTFAEALRGRLEGAVGVEVIVAPPFLALPAVAEALRGSAIGVASQDLHWEPKGAFTGEVSAPMVREAGAKWALVGHSERRQFFGETDETAARKVAAAFAGGLVAILCVGETLEERKAGRTWEVLDRQIRGGLARLTDGGGDRIIVAYEPVWAIGTGETATPGQAQEAHRFLRDALRSLVGKSADAVRILYGGSVKPDNIAGLMAQPDVDGGLVGGASLEVESFARIARWKETGGGGR